MNIIACVRTLNEERMIPHFCAGYDWADKVLIADGGSTDWTVKTANLFPNVYVREFKERIPMNYPPGFMNPEPAHMNFLVEWAEEEGADWIVYDDADGWPNPALKGDGRDILESAQEPAVYLHRFYLWGEDKYFPRYDVAASLWAWRPDEMMVRWDQSVKTNFETRINGIDRTRVLELKAPPYCLLHNFATDEEHVQSRLKRYEAWGHPQVHPLASMYAPPIALPGWVYD